MQAEGGNLFLSQRFQEKRQPFLQRLSTFSDGGVNLFRKEDAESWNLCFLVSMFLRFENGHRLILYLYIFINIYKYNYFSLPKHKN